MPHLNQYNIEVYDGANREDVEALTALVKFAPECELWMKYKMSTSQGWERRKHNYTTFTANAKPRPIQFSPRRYYTIGDPYAPHSSWSPSI